MWEVLCEDLPAIQESGENHEDRAKDEVVGDLEIHKRPRDGTGRNDGQRCCKRLEQVVCIPIIATVGHDVSHPDTKWTAKCPAICLHALQERPGTLRSQSSIE